MYHRRSSRYSRGYSTYRRSYAPRRRTYGRPQAYRSVYGARAGYARRPMRRRFTVGGSRW